MYPLSPVLKINQKHLHEASLPYDIDLLRAVFGWLMRHGISRGDLCCGGDEERHTLAGFINHSRDGGLAKDEPLELHDAAWYHLPHSGRIG